MFVSSFFPVTLKRGCVSWSTSRCMPTYKLLRTNTKFQKMADGSSRTFQKCKNNNNLNICINTQKYSILLFVISSKDNSVKVTILTKLQTKESKTATFGVRFIYFFNQLML